MDKPLISIIIPVHNSGNTIRMAIDSIATQTYPSIEIIVINDNSTDDTKKIVMDLIQKDARIRYYALPENDPDRIDPILKRNINAGYAARNFGCTKANGTLITFQDADDVSLRNRLEVQHDLLTKYNATHLCTAVIPFDEKLIGTTFDMEVSEYEKNIINPEKLYALSQKTKGLVPKLFPALATRIPFRFKRLRAVNKLFFGSLTAYPGAGNSPLFKREVLEKVQFRKLADRVWPSFMGRGADRDFNFQVAETFKNSFVVPVPLYMWNR